MSDYDRELEKLRWTILAAWAIYGIDAGCVTYALTNKPGCAVVVGIVTFVGLILWTDREIQRHE